MNVLWSWFAGGGYVMAALGMVAMALYFLILERFLATGAQIRSIRSRVPAPGRTPPPAEAPTGLRRMGLIRACIVVAPLLGLLGTVTGMIETFDSILYGGYVTEMSRGICKALLTTQYGLAIAAPALVAEQILIRRLDKLSGLVRAWRLSHEGGA